MTQDLAEIRGLARDFARAELRPHAERWDAARALDEDVPGKLAELGFFGMLVPESDGGMGFDLPTVLVALEELAWGEPAVAMMVAQNIIAAELLRVAADAALRDRWLEPIATGESLATFVMAAGPDDGVSGIAPLAALAELLFVRHADTVLCVERGRGVQYGEPVGTLGLRPLGFQRITLDAAAAAAAVALGSAAVDRQPIAALTVAAVAVGIAQAALDHAVGYAAEREQFGEPIRSFEGVQVRLADMATRTLAARVLVAEAARQPESVLYTAAAKYAAGEAAMKVTDDAVQIYGGYGYMRDYPVEKLMRDAKAMSILHGSSELQRRRIAAALYDE